MIFLLKLKQKIIYTDRNTEQRITDIFIHF